MPSLDEEFGPQPGRPSHQDFVLLSGLIRSLDSKMDLSLNPQKTFVEIVTAIIDPETLRYAAMQRALRAIGGGPGSSAPDRTIVALAGLYMDGFTAGATFAKEKRQ